MAPLTPSAALTELLARLGVAPGQAVALSGDELGRWPDNLVAALKAQGVLRPGKPGDTANCPGCEQACVMAVQMLTRPGRPAAAFIVCDKRDDINRVPLDALHLERWRATERSLADALAGLLGGGEAQQVVAGGAALRLGVVTGLANKAAVHLRFDDQGRALLDVAGHALELAVLLSVQGERLLLDTRHLARCVDTPAVGVALPVETAEQRSGRLQARRAVLQRQDVKAFLQLIAQEEGVSVSMVKKILGRTTAPALKDTPLDGWGATIAILPGVSPDKTRKR